jgi:hypothetical protein
MLIILSTTMCTAAVHVILTGARFQRDGRCIV